MLRTKITMYFSSELRSHSHVECLVPTPKIHLVAKLLVLTFLKFAVSSDQLLPLRATSVPSKHPRPIDQAWDGRTTRWSARRRRPAATSMSGSFASTDHMDWRSTFQLLRSGIFNLREMSRSIRSRLFNVTAKTSLFFLTG